MSSFIGHGLTALTIGRTFEKNETAKSFVLWQGCLLLCVYAPDADYLIPSLNRLNNNGLRITHTIAFSLLLPALLTFLILLFDRKNLFSRGIQASLGGLSHLLMDLLVGGSSGDPLFYPFSKEKIVLPFGILPSAAAINLSNYYFYRNTLIELGILIPVFAFMLVTAGKLKINKFISGLLFCIFLIFLVWSISLKR